MYQYIHLEEEDISSDTNYFYDVANLLIEVNGIEYTEFSSSLKLFMELVIMKKNQNLANVP